MQLTPYLSSGKEHGLGINVHVALWLDYRNFQNKPPLQVVPDCVNVTNELHDEFDDFNDREAIVDVSVLPFVELLQFWCARQGIPPLPFLKYGKNTSSSPAHKLIIYACGLLRQEGNSKARVKVFLKESLQLQQPLNLMSWKMCQTLTSLQD